MKLGISSSCFYPLLTEDAFLKVASYGTQTSEIFFNALCELSPEFVGKLKDIQKEYNQHVTSVHPTMSLAESFMIFSSYERRYTEAMDQYKRYSEIVCELGGKYIIMHGGKPNNVIDNRQYYEKFAKVAEAVKENGAVLLQENVVKFRAGNLQVLCDMADYLGEDAAFCLDIKQSIRGGYSAFEVLDKIGQYVKHIHISDSTDKNDCLLPLNGNFDFPLFFEKAKQKGFDGSAIIEVYENAFSRERQLFESYEKLKKKIF